MGVHRLACTRGYAFNWPAAPAKWILRPLSATSVTRTRAEEQISTVEAKGIAALSPRWLSDLKNRIGRCISFGLHPEQVQRAAGVLNIIAKEWRGLVAGSEGFLTDPKRAGLERHNVVWGEMDTMVYSIPSGTFVESKKLKSL